MPSNIQVLNKFAIYSGIDSDELSDFELICDECLNDVLGELKSGINPDSYSSKICSVAAALALYRCCLQRELDGGSEDVSIGNIRINTKKQTGSEYAYKLYTQIKKHAQNIFCDDEFYFGCVSVV